MESDLNDLADLSDLTDLTDLTMIRAAMLITVLVDTTLELTDRQHPYQLLNEVNK